MGALDDVKDPSLELPPLNDPDAESNEAEDVDDAESTDEEEEQIQEGQDDL